MKVFLKIWRQENRHSEGQMIDYVMEGIHPEMSFLEMLDTLNEKLIVQGEEPVEFDHDCREGICGQCGVVINGRTHGPLPQTTTCQLHMRHFKDGDTIYIEPFRASSFPVIRDLKIDRTAFDRIIQAGGFITVNTGSAPDANANLLSHNVVESAFDAAACIGCGACVATCKNSSAALFTGAKVSHFAQLVQGKEEATTRVRNMVKAMDTEGFGHCSNTGACEVECPQAISLGSIAHMNFEYIKAGF